MLIILIVRIDLQDRVRRQRSNPDEYNQQVIEQKRVALASMLGKLKQLQVASGVVAIGPGSEPFVENEDKFDEVTELASANQSDDTNETTTVAEHEILILPSNGNIFSGGVAVEICHRT